MRIGIVGIRSASVEEMTERTSAVVLAAGRGGTAGQSRLDLLGAPRSIDANAVGEHGDSEVCLWSSPQVGGRALRDWPGWSAAREEAIAERVRRAAYERAALDRSAAVVRGALADSA